MDSASYSWNHAGILPHKLESGVRNRDAMQAAPISHRKRMSTDALACTTVPNTGTAVQIIARGAGNVRCRDAPNEPRRAGIGPCCRLVFFVPHGCLRRQTALSSYGVAGVYKIKDCLDAVQLQHQHVLAPPAQKA